MSSALKHLVDCGAHCFARLSMAAPGSLPFTVRNALYRMSRLPQSRPSTAGHEHKPLCSSLAPVWLWPCLRLLEKKRQTTAIVTTRSIFESIFLKNVSVRWGVRYLRNLHVKERWIVSKVELSGLTMSPGRSYNNRPLNKREGAIVANTARVSATRTRCECWYCTVVWQVWTVLCLLWYRTINSKHYWRWVSDFRRQVQPVLGEVCSFFSTLSVLTTLALHMASQYIYRYCFSHQKCV